MLHASVDTSDSVARCGLSHGRMDGYRLARQQNGPPQADRAFKRGEQGCQGSMEGLRLVATVVGDCSTIDVWRPERLPLEQAWVDWIYQLGRQAKSGARMICGRRGDRTGHPPLATPCRATSATARTSLSQARCTRHDTTPSQPSWPLDPFSQCRSRLFHLHRRALLSPPRVCV